MSIKQDGCVPRTPTDVDRRYKNVPGEVNEIKKMVEEYEVDDTLSTSSTNPVQNRVVTVTLNNKVSKEAGKSLSTNDYTTEEKTKLSEIETQAEVNTIETIKVNGVAQQVTNKEVNLSILNQTVDTEMSSTSENAVQNKIIKAYVDEHVGSGVHEYSHTDNAGYIWFQDGFLVQWGRASATPSAINTDTTLRVLYHYDYTDIPDVKLTNISATPTIAKVSGGGGTTVQQAKEGINIYINSSTTRAVNVTWESKGHKTIT